LQILQTQTAPLCAARTTSTSDLAGYASWPADTEATIVLTVDADGHVGLPTIGGEPFQLIDFPGDPSTPWVPGCRAVTLPPRSALYVGGPGPAGGGGPAFLGAIRSVSVDVAPAAAAPVRIQVLPATLVSSAQLYSGDAWFSATDWLVRTPDNLGGIWDPVYSGWPYWARASFAAPAHLTGFELFTLGDVTHDPVDFQMECYGADDASGDASALLATQAFTAQTGTEAAQPFSFGEEMRGHTCAAFRIFMTSGGSEWQAIVRLLVFTGFPA
jgi:hypothetical protein